MLSTEESKRLAAEFVEEVFNKGNLAYLHDALADDFVDHTPPPGGTPDKAGTIAFFEEMAKTASDVQVEIVQVVASENKVALHGRWASTRGVSWGLRPPPESHTRWRASTSPSTTIGARRLATGGFRT